MALPSPSNVNVNITSNGSNNNVCDLNCSSGAKQKTYGFFYQSLIENVDTETTCANSKNHIDIACINGSSNNNIGEKDIEQQSQLYKPNDSPKGDYSNTCLSNISQRFSSHESKTDNFLTHSSPSKNNQSSYISQSSSFSLYSKATATDTTTMPSTSPVVGAATHNHSSSSTLSNGKHSSPTASGHEPENSKQTDHKSINLTNSLYHNNNNLDKHNGSFYNSNNNLSHFHQNAFNGLDTAAAIAAAALSNSSHDFPDTDDPDAEDREPEPVFFDYSAETSSTDPPSPRTPNNNSHTSTLNENGSHLSGSSTPNNSYQHKTQRPSDHRDELLSSINALRKQGQFCDVKLLVEDHEVSAHRAVLASTSPYLFDFLSCLEECEGGQLSQPQTYRLKDVPFVGFQHLLDYMYTGRLHVPLHEVPLVYGTAIALRMDVPARASAHFLSSHLTDANCLVIRRFSRDESFRAAVDEYIQANMDGILNSKSFFGLNNLQIEIVGLDESIDDEIMERRLFSLVLNWAKTRLNDLKPKMERLIEQVNVLYLNQDNTLLDCADIEDNVLSSDDDVVTDYKKMARRRSKTKVHSHKTNGSSSHLSNGSSGQSFHKFQLNPEEAVSQAEREWSIIATRKTNDNSYLSIAVLDGKLMAVSLHVRPQIATASSDGNVSGNDLDSPTSVGNPNAKGSTPPLMRKASIAPLECMSTARCAMGAVHMNGNIVVFGGYDRGECLQSVESFSLQDNQWTSLPPMKAARGRFGAAAIDGCVYTCGGSDGWKELSCVERFEPTTGTWKFVASMIKERSSHGVATLNGKLYCVGGSDGQRSIADCEVYDPATDTWSSIASLNQARIQTCVCAYQGMLYAIGGTDQWNTLSSVEVYDPEHNQWIMSSQLNIARRGAAVDIVDDMMIVVGGSDGVTSLTSTELYNAAALQWTIGPQMATPRANLSAVAVGHRLFAIGGFSGKKFLSTAEWLDCEGGEWLGLAPKMVDLDASRSTGDEGEMDTLDEIGLN